MDIKEVRVERLKRFVADNNGPAAVARKFEGIDASYLSQLINGHRPFGEKSARRIEMICGLEPNYFDQLVLQQYPEEYRVKDLLQKMDDKTRQQWLDMGTILASPKD